MENKKQKKLRKKMEKIKGFLWENRRVIIISLSVIAFLTIVYFLASNQIQAFDEKVYSFFQPMISGHATILFRVITATGGATFLIVFTVVLMLFRKEKITRIAIPLNLVLVTFLNLVIKEIARRPRPVDIGLIQEVGFSFPSAHAMVNTAFYGFIIYLIYRNEKNVVKRNILCILLALLILGICSSRIYLGVHYASDVLAGMCLSLIYLAIFTKWYKTRKEKSCQGE